jgi:hypothetical protein
VAILTHCFGRVTARPSEQKMLPPFRRDCTKRHDRDALDFEGAWAQYNPNKPRKQMPHESDLMSRHTCGRIHSARCSALLSALHSARSPQSDRTEVGSSNSMHCLASEQVSTDGSASLLFAPFIFSYPMNARSNRSLRGRLESLSPVCRPCINANFFLFNASRII